MDNNQSSTPKVAFVGAGNMAAAIIGGLVTSGYPASQICASNRNQSRLQNLKDQFGIEITASNLEAVAQAEVVVLSVKPQMLQAVAEELADKLAHKPVLISVAAGISLDTLAQWLGNDQAIVRCMPNTPSLVSLGASGLVANELTQPEQKAICERILGAVGIALWLESEEQIHAVTAVSGSGPAYFFYFMEAMITEGVRQGLTADIARKLAIETALGAATLAKNSEEGPDVLRRRVTSPGGTTEQAIFSFDRANLSGVVSDAMTACAERSRKMAEEFK